MRSVVTPTVLSTVISTVLNSASSPAGATLAFHALTPDPTTKEMTGVLTGTGGLTTTHTADLYAPDFEGVYREFGANEPVWSGGRVVTNNVIDSVAMDSGWASNVTTVTPNVADPDGGNNAIRLTTGAAGQVHYFNVPVVVGDDVVASYWVRRVSGTGDITFYAGRAASGGAVISITTSWKRVTPEQWVATSTTGRTGVQIVVSGDSIELYAPQHEIINGQSNQNPSEYIPTTTAPVTKVFANENGNTVTDNVVTEAVGADLPEMPYLQYYPAAENSCLNSRNLESLTWLTDIGVGCILR